MFERSLVIDGGHSAAAWYTARFSRLGLEILWVLQMRVCCHSWWEVEGSPLRPRVRIKYNELQPNMTGTDKYYPTTLGQGSATWKNHYAVPRLHMSTSDVFYETARVILVVCRDVWNARYSFTRD